MKRPRRLVPLLCLIASPLVWASGDDERPGALGPASAEARLRKLLERAVVDADSEGGMVGILGSARESSGESSPSPLDRVLDLAVRLVEAAPPPAPGEWPDDAGLLLLLTRHLPVATPPAWIPTLRGELGVGPARDVALIEMIAKAPRTAARDSLRAMLAGSVARQPPVERQCALLHALRYLEDLDGAYLLFQLQTSADPRLRHFARTAYQVLLSRVTRGEHHDALADYLDGLASRHPPGFVFRLEATAKHVRKAADLTALLAPLDELVAATSGRSDSGWQVNHREALLARAIAGQLAGQDFEAVRSWLRRAASPDRPLLDREDEVRVVCLRAQLLEAFLMEVAGQNSADRFRRILEEAPVDDDTNLLDRAWFGSFGPDFLNDPLRRRGHSDAVRRAFDQLVKAIEDSTEQTGYGVLQRHEEQEERSVSWSFLEAGRLRLEDQGDPTAAGDFARQRIPLLEAMSRWNNLELVVHTRILEARSHLYLRDAAAAHRTLDSARAMAEGLRTGYQREMVRMTDRGEVPPVPAESTFRGEGPVYRDLLARVHLMDSTVRSTLENDARGAARHLFLAGEHMDWSVDRWMAVALDQARRGLHSLARRSLACVEPLPDQLYDQACVAAFLGDGDRAVTLLHSHLERRTYTAAGRALEIEYMAADPDLAAVHGHPDFPRP